MKRILIHIHIYYTEMWPELKSCLQNIFATADCRLYVTMVEAHEDIASDIRAFCPEAVIDIVENRGFDIAPFIHVLNKVDLSFFDYIVKLHTKRNIDARPFFINGYDVGGEKWRHYLLSFCKTPKNWQKTLYLLEDKNVTMVSNYHLIMKPDDNVKLQDLRVLEEFLGIVFSEDRRFVAGTMFAAKASIFLFLQHKFKCNDFSFSQRCGQDMLPYIFERIFGYLNADGALVSFDNKKASCFRYLFLFIKNFLYKKKITSQKTIIKVMGIEIYKKIATK